MIDYNIGLAVGYVITAKEIYRQFGKTMPEESHMEDRYDPKTGAKLKPVKVIDRKAGRILILKGQDLDDEIIPILEYIDDQIGCTHWEEFNYGDDPEDAVYVFGPHIKCDDHGFDDCRVHCDGQVTLSQIVEREAEFKRIHTGLSSLGLPPYEGPVVRICVVCG